MAVLVAEQVPVATVRKGDRVVGHFVVVSASGLSYPTREQRRVATALVDQVRVLPQAGVA